MATYVIRSFGSVLLLNTTPTPTPTPTQFAVVQVTFRDGETRATFRDGVTKATFRDGTTQSGGR